MNLKRYKKFNILAILLSCIIIYGIRKEFSITEVETVIMIEIIIILLYVLIYSNNKYKKLFKLSENRKRKYNLAIDILEVVLWEWNSENKEIFISPKIKYILKEYKNDVYTFKELISYVVEEDRESIKTFFYDLIQDNIIDDFVLECSIINNVGEIIIIEIQGKSIFKDDIFLISGYLKDITLKKHKENINKLIENKNRLAVEGAKNITFWLNVNQSIISLDRSIKDYIDFEGERDLVTSYTNWKSNIIDEDVTIYDGKILDIIKNKENEFYSMEYRIKNKNGGITWFQSKGKKTSEKNGDIFLYGSISDITQRKELEIKQEYLTYTDEVTGIANRRYFFKEVDEFINKCNDNLAIIFIDLDNFKYINDTYGHDVGDNLLIGFTKIIKEINEKDTLLARYGGDEFIIAKYNYKSVDEVKSILDKIIKKLSRPLIIRDKELFCTLSIGVSLYPKDGISIKELIKRADMAMYLAKINGKNRYEVFDIQMLQILDREFEIEKGLRVAVENNEIKMIYQPKISVETGEIIGFEALVRWNSKDLGFVSPKEFIPIAENSGLIIPIGKYIIDEVFKNCREILLETDKKFKIAINLSDVQIRDEKIVDFIDETLKKYNIESKYIEFEITESIIMKAPEKNIKTLEKLKSLGATLALDDFGTGYSSLSYLRTLPLDALKIDKSFIDGIVIEEKSEYIINSIIELSHYLNLVVVAEGVEREEQLDYLRKIKCDIIQGYYFSKPIDFIEAKKMLLKD